MRSASRHLTLRGSDIFLIGSAIGYGLKIQSAVLVASPSVIPIFFFSCLHKSIRFFVTYLGDFPSPPTFRGISSLSWSPLVCNRGVVVKTSNQAACAKTGLSFLCFFFDPPSDLFQSYLGTEWLLVSFLLRRWRPPKLIVILFMASTTVCCKSLWSSFSSVFSSLKEWLSKVLLRQLWDLKNSGALKWYCLDLGAKYGLFIPSAFDFIPPSSSGTTR